MKRLFVLALAVLPTVVAGQAASVSGTWNVAANIGGMPIEMQCVLAQKDTDLTGTCTSQQQPLPIAGKLDGKKVSWQFDTVYDGQTLTVVYAGTVDAPEKITGNVDVRPMSVSGDFTATKAK